MVSVVPSAPVLLDLYAIAAAAVSKAVLAAATFALSSVTEAPSASNAPAESSIETTGFASDL